MNAVVPLGASYCVVRKASQGRSGRLRRHVAKLPPLKNALPGQWRSAKRLGLCIRASESGSEPALNNSREPASQPEGLDSSALPENFCIIEGRDTVQDFAKLKINEIKENINSRRTKIFLLMEEVRRLRIQARLATGEEEEADEAVVNKEYSSAIPLLPPLTDDTIQTYYNVFALSITSIILFGGLVAPVLEVKLGIGGSSYSEFINRVHLPAQLAQVDPFVASFTGGAVGVITTLLVVELNNVKAQSGKRCKYCKGTGYLGCAVCQQKGTTFDIRTGTQVPCTTCASTGKVMCTSCFCTGMGMASEHDPRIDPFD